MPENSHPWIVTPPVALVTPNPLMFSKLTPLIVPPWLPDMKATAAPTVRLPVGADNPLSVTELSVSEAAESTWNQAVVLDWGWRVVAGRLSPTCDPSIVRGLVMLITDSAVIVSPPIWIVSPEFATATAAASDSKALVPYVSPVTGMPLPVVNVTVSPALSPVGATSFVIWNSSLTYSVAGVDRSSRRSSCGRNRSES